MRRAKWNKAADDRFDSIAVGDSMRVLHFNDLVATPWKNGEGLTREIARAPMNSTLEDFSWRVSIADVHQSGPFSEFPGVDRVIALLDGAGMRLEIDDGRVHDLTTPHTPFHFRGEDAVYARLLGGGCRDINLMLRRAVVYGEVEVCREHRHLIWEDALASVLYCRSGSWLITSSSGASRMLIGSEILIDNAPTGFTSILPLDNTSVVVCITVGRRTSEGVA
jgi:uncharacterized protein